MEIDTSITYCNNRNCTHQECLRFYKNAKMDVCCLWETFNKKEDLEGNECKHYL